MQLADMPDSTLLAHMHQQREQHPQAWVAAFEVLFTRHYARVYRVAHNLTGNHDEAEDLTQETFLALYRQPPHLHPTDDLAPWLGRVMLNRGYNALRSGQRRQQRETRAYGLTIQEPHSTRQPAWSGPKNAHRYGQCWPACQSARASCWCCAMLVFRTPK
ncbi:MAG: RNA polymerase sigma factor [Chloroflexaceae bacterium]|nr:RNA polymerase sigma factor [Chloroflexaceae bacterium]